MTLTYLLVGLFITWTIGIIIVAKSQNYIEWLVKTMWKEKDI